MKAKSEGLVPVSNAHLGKMPSYTVYGGLVFVKLTLAYLRCAKIVVNIFALTNE
jgi:hypothetical protein